MRRMYAIAIGMGLATTFAAAQDEIARDKVRVELERALVNAKMVGVEAGVMSSPVKGAPYTAEEVTTRNQVLADGTTIHNESTATVYRDSEGRIRRETPNEVVLMDPVANSRIAWSSKSMTGNKSTLGYTTRIMVTHDGGRSVVFKGGAAGGPGGPGVTNFAVETGEIWTEKAAIEAKRGGVKTESLNSQVIEGLTVQGTRSTTTIDAGAIGNDRPINIVSERWYSPDLQTLVMSRTTDPRNGEETFQLRNVRRGEPDPSLFQPPAGFQINERK